MPDVPLTLNFPASLDTVVSGGEVANRAFTTLSNTITDTALSIPLTDSTVFPATGVITLTDSLTAPTKTEDVIFTANSANTLTVPTGGRGAFGSTAQNWSGTVYVRMRMLAEHHEFNRDAVIALETKLGYTASTPTNGKFLAGSTTAGTSAWRVLAANDIPDLSATYALSGHNHSGVYEPANANIQAHIASTSNPHSVTKSQVGLGSVENTALSTWTGSTNLTTLGTISAGTWNGAVIGASYGGAGTISGILKANGSGTVSAADSGTDYLSATAPGSTKQLLYNNANAYAGAAGVEYQASASPMLTLTGQNASQIVQKIKPFSDAPNDYVWMVENAAGTTRIKIDPCQWLDQTMTLETTVVDAFVGVNIFARDASDTTAGIVVGHDAGTGFFAIEYRGAGATGSGLIHVPNGANLRTGNAIDALTFATQKATAPIVFASGGVASGNEILRLTPSSGAQFSAAPVSKTAAGVSIGSASLPFKYGYFAGDSGTPGTNNFKLTGTATAARTITLPDATDTLVGKATTDTLTNKTLTASSNVLGGVTMTLGSDADGDMYYRSSNVLTRLPKGTANQQLRMNAGATAPEWFTASSGGLTVGTSAITSGTATRLLYETSGNVLGEISGATSDGANVTFGSGNLIATSAALTTPAITTSATVTRTALGATTATGLELKNTTAAAAGAQQVSPATVWTGEGWKTNATAGTQTVNFQAYVLPVQGAANPSANLIFASQINGGGYTSRMILDSGGGLYLGAGRIDSGGVGGTFTVNAQNITGRVSLYNDYTGILVINAGNQSGSSATGFGIVSSTTTAGNGPDVMLSRAGAASWRLGGYDKASPTAYTLGLENVVAGTSNTAGANWTFKASAGTGSAAGGSFIWQVAPAGSSGTSQNTFFTAMTLAADKTLTFGDAVNLVMGTTTGTKIGTATGQKIGFWNATPVVQQILATGAGATVDNVISLLQTLGLCKQS